MGLDQSPLPSSQGVPHLLGGSLHLLCPAGPPTELSVDQDGCFVYQRCSLLGPHKQHNLTIE